MDSFQKFINRINRYPVIEEINNINENRPGMEFNSVSLIDGTEDSVIEARTKIMKKFVPHGVVLNRMDHIEYLCDHLKGLSSRQVGADASHAWV
jgi:hypothetical protein